MLENCRETLLFVDIANIEIKAGDGGNGAVSFYRSPATALGGPDGGNGGKGGDVIFQTDSNISTLYKFRTKKNFLLQTEAMALARSAAVNQVKIFL